MTVSDRSEENVRFHGCAPAMVLTAAAVLTMAWSGEAEERPFATFAYVVEDEETSGVTVDCPGEETIKSAVSERLGYVPWRPDAPIHIETKLTVRSDGIHAAIVVLDESGTPVGERHIRSRESCKEVAKGVELAVAIAIDPLSFNREPQPEPEPEAPEVSTPPDVPRQTDCPAVETPEGPATRLFADIGGFGAWRTAPAITGGLRAGLGVRWNIASLGFSGRFDLPASKALHPGTLGAHQALAELAPCIHLPYTVACAVVAGGVLRTDVSGLVDARRATLPSLSAGIRFGADIPLGRVVFVRAFGDVLVSLIRNTLRETGSEHLFWKTPPFGICWGIAVGVIFFDGTARATTIDK